MIGAGVLALPYSMASLGWILGPICFVLFAVITLYTAQLLADLYFIDGKRMRTYTDMVSYCFGLPGMIAIGIVQQFNLVLTALAYTITATISIQALANSYCATHCIPYGQPDDCLNADGTPSNPDGTINNCFNKFWEWAIIFGALQIVLNQIPTLEKFWWMSIIGAIMSFGYSFIAFGMTVAYGEKTAVA